MANSSGFIDYSTYAGLNADEETRLLEEAMRRAQQADTDAQAALGRARQDASARYGADGQLTGGTELSKAASYSDYLKAADDAKKQWAAIFRDGADPRGAALREQLRGRLGAVEQRDAAEAGLRDAEGRISERLAGEAASVTKMKGEADARAAAKAASDKEAADAFEQARAKYVQDMAEKAKARAAAGVAQRDYVGAYNPYADSTWAQSQGAFEAQQIANAGGSQAQQESAWQAYTGKGRWGTQQDWKKHMNRSMTPYAPPKKEG